MSRPIRTILLSTLYPSAVRPVHGIFVETRLRELLKSGQVETKVVAPVPWFPSSNPHFGAYANLASTPKTETLNGINVYHPRYFLPPKIGQNLAPFVLAAGALPTIRKLIKDGFDFDLIDAHYIYPDSVAASIIARKIGKPFTCTARGSDINVFKNFVIPRRLIQKTLQRSAANIGVCRDIVQQMEELGAPPEKSKVLRNGVDLLRFFPVHRNKARNELNISGNGLVLLSVGNLIELKGHDLVIRLLAERPQGVLVIVGSGPEENNLRRLAISLGLAQRVLFAGQQPNDQLKTYFSAADVTVLASSREGWANVLLESMACGTPVVATRVNGTPEVVASSVVGRLAERRDVGNLQTALESLLAKYPERNSVRQYAENFSWEATSKGQIAIFRELICKTNTSSLK